MTNSPQQTAQPQPDIEIYAKDLSVDTLLSWLNKHFDKDWDDSAICQHDFTSKKPVDVQLYKQGVAIELMVTPSAAGKAFTSLWFKSGNTGWHDDLECAESLLSELDGEVRCSAESWSEEEPEYSEKWWKITRNTRELIVWG